MKPVVNSLACREVACTTQQCVCSNHGGIGDNYNFKTIIFLSHMLKVGNKYYSSRAL